MGRRNTSRSGGGSSNATTRRDHLRQLDGRADNWRSRRDNLLTEEDSEAETMRMAGSIQRENHAEHVPPLAELQQFRCFPESLLRGRTIRAME